ncbi:MAG: MBL fold metallo-hydrolase, partial [Lachnospiraceae bacterium]|nr:MBL fold metallo-hydrolase [Lachnospiraceae bacterium]
MKVTDSIKYVGVDDTELDLFESQYPVEEGISYNSYIIMDEMITVMDTVDARGSEEWMERVEETLGGAAPAYLVVSHLEPDHSANIQKLAEKYPDMKLVGSAKTKAMLPQFFDIDDSRVVAVAEGETLSIGSHTLQFFMAPMVHWPEVMVTYEQSEKVLFSADGFGTFGAICEGEEWIADATHYYFNIVGKYGPSVQALLKKAKTLDITMIAPLHGPVLTGDLSYYIGKYDAWSS